MSGRTIITLFGVLSLLWSPAYAGDKGERPAILDAKVFVADGLIVSDLTSRGLFSDQIIGTVQSGLPAVVELLYTLVSHDNKTVNRGLHAYELRYDVWEDFYSVTGADSTRQYASFKQMASAIEHLRKIAIVPVSTVNLNHQYAIRFSIAVHPLRGKEKRQMIGWVGENVRGGTEESWREQVLNLNELIEHFFAREKDSADRSEWYRTSFFNPGRLPSVEADAAASGGTVETEPNAGRDHTPGGESDSTANVEGK
ncbi:MAG: hypothetical protein JSW58_17135 [Candidatus Latescibacterota bacterium]|nr:MAG: hypothetical protein JSW58_17135 [Candidatus Latescibacterota bacterium]